MHRPLPVRSKRSPSNFASSSLGDSYAAYNAGIAASASDPMAANAATYQASFPSAPPTNLASDGAACFAAPEAFQDLHCLAPCIPVIPFKALDQRGSPRLDQSRPRPLTPRSRCSFRTLEVRAFVRASGPRPRHRGRCLRAPWPRQLRHHAGSSSDSISSGTTPLAAGPNSERATDAFAWAFASSLVSVTTHSLADLPPIVVGSSPLANAEMNAARANPIKASQRIGRRPARGVRECAHVDVIVFGAFQPGSRIRNTVFITTQLACDSFHVHESRSIIAFLRRREQTADRVGPTRRDKKCPPFHWILLATHDYAKIPITNHDPRSAPGTTTAHVQHPLAQGPSSRRSLRPDVRVDLRADRADQAAAWRPTLPRLPCTARSPTWPGRDRGTSTSRSRTTRRRSAPSSGRTTRGGWRST